MTIPVTALHILRVMLQAEQNLSGLQKDMRNNALSWKAMAQAQNPDVVTLAGYMDSSAATYQARLGWLATMQSDAANWTKISAMWATMGGTGQDFSNLITPLQSVADGLGPASKNTYSKIIGICNQITTVVNAPLSLWPE
jgi:hypothetical protein